MSEKSVKRWLPLVITIAVGLFLCCLLFLDFSHIKAKSLDKVAKPPKVSAPAG